MAPIAPTEVKKMKQGMSYSGKEKTIILNVFKYFRSQFPEKCVTEIVRRTAKATGCSEKSIFQFRKEEISPHGFKEPSRTKIRKNININSRFVKYNDNVREEIKKIVYELKNNNIVPSLSVILKNINSNDSLPTFSLMTLRRLLFDMGFCYEKNGNKSILVEKSLKNESNQGHKALSNKKPLQPTQPSSITNISGDLVGNSSELKPCSNNLQQSVIKVVPLTKVERHNSSQIFCQTFGQTGNHQTQRVQPLGGFQENHYVNANSHPPTHNMPPMMFSHRVHQPYHIHSSVPPPPHPTANVDLRIKRDGSFMHPHHPHLPPHNMIMH